ncbi:MAG: alpha/beta hydrolase [Erysipelotrichaceae bacterium]|nr:alpha/beta hydrolase [Erysipelotrichaceae bacterium]
MKKIINALACYIKKAWKQLFVLLSLLIVSTSCIAIANGIQTGFGSIKVESGYIETNILNSEETVNIGFKIYIPKEASKTNKVPAVLCLHGYQNDHETSAAYALELARRGIVALCIDEYGHGSTDVGMIERGYVNHKVTTNYGYDEFGKTYLEIGGVTRYKVLMNFSNLSFFSDYYTNSYDFETNTIISQDEAAYIKDSSMGGAASYAWLSSLEYVDKTKMAITGHSMGTWAGWSVAAAYSNTDIEPRATALQCGELFKTIRDDNGRLAYDKDNDNLADIHWNNVLLITAKYDEFNYFRDYIKTPVTNETVKNEIRSNFLGVSQDEAAFNVTFHEDFAKGTSVRNEYIITNHRLTTHDKNAVKSVIDWFFNAFEMTSPIASSNQVFMIKEVLVLLAMLCGIASCVAMAMCLKPILFFSSVFQKVPNRPEKVKKGWKFYKGAIITILLSGLTYPFLTQLGHGLMPLPEKVFKMTIGNGFLVWYIFLILVMLGFTLIPWFKEKKKGVKTTDFVDLGFARDDEQHKNKFDWVLFAKALLVAFIGVLWMYLQVITFEKLAQLDYRFIWPFFKGFSLSRFVQFIVYLPFFALFFILNNSRIFAIARVEHTEEKGIAAFFKCWWKYALCMSGGILLLCLIEYVPFFAQIGPGADLLFSTTFGGPFMSLLIVFAPQVIVFSFICTYCYRKTGNVFLGALIVAMLSCWIITGGSAMLYA